MRHLVRAMSGSDVGDEELRSAVEEETGRDFAEFFRTWLDHPGVPAEFLKRYSDERELRAVLFALKFRPETDGGECDRN